MFQTGLKYVIEVGRYKCIIYIFILVSKCVLALMRLKTARLCDVINVWAPGKRFVKVFMFRYLFKRFVINRIVKSFMYLR